MSKRSATSSRPPPEPLCFFIDRDLGVHDVASALRALGARVELHRDHFAHTTPDPEWITEVSARGWVILTQDRAIARHPHERAAVLASRARYFCVAGGSRRGEETAMMVATHLRTIEHVARTHPVPIIARVTREGVTVRRAKDKSWVRAKRRPSTSAPTGPRTNERIRVPEVRVIGPEGEMLGVIETRDALRFARERDLDLVEVNPKAVPPVCKVMDFGKFKYEAARKAREAKKK